MFLTAGLVLVIANLVDLSAIASVGSAVSLMVFVLVAAAGWRLRHETGTNPVLAVCAIGISVIVLAFFAVDTWNSAPFTFVAVIGLTALPVALDALTRRGLAAAES